MCQYGLDYFKPRRFSEKIGLSVLVYTGPRFSIIWRPNSRVYGWEGGEIVQCRAALPFGKAVCVYHTLCACVNRRAREGAEKRLLQFIVSKLIHWDFSTPSLLLSLWNFLHPSYFSLFCPLLLSFPPFLSILCEHCTPPELHKFMRIERIGFEAPAPMHAIPGPEMLFENF